MKKGRKAGEKGREEKKKSDRKKTSAKGLRGGGGGGKRRDKKLKKLSTESNLGPTDERTQQPVMC